MWLKAHFHERMFSRFPKSLQVPFLENCPVILKLPEPPQKYIHSEKSKYNLKHPPSTGLEWNKENLLLSSILPKEVNGHRLTRNLRIHRLSYFGGMV